MKRTFYIVLLALVVLQLPAQEELRPLSCNLNYLYPALQQPAAAIKNNGTARTMATSLYLPFKEDFYYAPTHNYADPNKWEDSLVYVNVGYGFDPPSIGVATFDGLNRLGFPYTPNLVNNTLSLPADTLTSKPINLLVTASSQTLQPSDSIALIFYYQPRGYGDPPESTDSLLLDFYMPDSTRWTNVWAAVRSASVGPNLVKYDTIFRRAFISITQPAYLKDGFRFRFRNTATTTGNFDHWNLDYIYLDMNRSVHDTIFDDLAFAYVPTPLLRDYAIMPYEQYNASEMAATNKVKIRNNGPATVNMTYEYRIDSVNKPLSSYTGFANLLQPYRAVGYSSYTPHARPTINYTFAPMTDSVDYTIKHFIYQSTSSVTTTDFIPQNDTVIQYQKFRNYYAMDDGGAEAGYYINQPAAKMAYKINVNVVDSFLGAKIYFDPVGQLNQAQNAAGFRICVWAPGSNGPGVLLFRDTVFKPLYYNFDPPYALGTYKLIRPLRLNPGTYYIGIQQLADIMTIGFDCNVDHHANFYFDQGAGWTKSTKIGSVMIHPVFGSTLPHPLGINEAGAVTDGFVIYPNPTSNQFTIRGGKEGDNMTCNLFNAIGQLVQAEQVSSTEHIVNTAQLPNGMYLVVLKNNKGLVQQQKLIIQR